MSDRVAHKFGIEDQETLEATLKTMRFNFILLPLIFLSFIIILNILRNFNDNFWLYLSGILLLASLERIYSAYKMKCVYKFKLDDDYLYLYHSNLFGKKNLTTIPIKSIMKIKRQPKAVTDYHSKLWIHTHEKVQVFILINSFIGLELYEVLDVEKL